MNKFILFLITMLFISCKETTKVKLEQKAKTATIVDFIPKAFEMVVVESKEHKVVSDLNGDGIADYIILLASGNTNDELYANATDVRVSIFEGQTNGSFQLKRQTGNLTAAFLYDNLYNEIIAVNAKGVLAISHQSMRHEYDLKFKYDNKTENYVLVKSELNNYASGIGAESITSKDFVSGKTTTKIGNETNTTIAMERKIVLLSDINDDTIYQIINK